MFEKRLHFFQYFKIAPFSLFLVFTSCDDDNEVEFKLLCEGKTGYPIVDTSM